MAGKFASLDELSSFFNSTKPGNDGSAEGAKGTRDYWRDYDDALKQLHDEGNSGDYATYSILRDYVSGERKRSEDYFNNIQLLAANAKDAKVEQGILKDQSLKRAQVSIDAAGLGGSGVGQSVMTGIGNQYATNVGAIDRAAEEGRQGAYEAYQQLANDNRIANEDAMHAQEQESNNSAYSLASEMLNAGVDLETVLSHYGEGLSDTQKQTLTDLWNASQGTANTTDSEWIKSNTTNSQGFKSYHEMVDADVRTENVRYGIDDVADEARLLFDRYTTGRKDGDCVRLEHYGGGSTNGVYMIYYKGSWYVTDKSHYDSAANKAFFKGGSFNSGSGTFTAR